MSALDDEAIEQFRQFSKATFSPDKITVAALEYRYTRELKRIISAELREPSEEFVRLLAGRIHEGRVTQSIRARFATFIKNAWRGLINDLITERLRAAMSTSEPSSHDGRAAETSESPALSLEPSSDITTTVEEIEAYITIKAILRDIVDPRRIFMRDMRSYCSILLDDNRRRTIARLYLEGSRKSILIMDATKKEERVFIETVDDIYKVADALRASAQTYLAAEK